MEAAPYDPDAEICEDMGCPFFFKQDDCRGPDECPRVDRERKMRGAIYLLGAKRGEHFVGFLPRLKKKH